MQKYNRPDHVGKVVPACDPVNTEASCKEGCVAAGVGHEVSYLNKKQIRQTLPEECDLLDII